MIRYTNPSSGSSNFSPSDGIGIYFDSAVDMQSVENAFQILPDVEPSFSWQTAYSPAELLTARFANILATGTRYVVTLKAGWKTATGRSINADYSFWFKTADMTVQSFVPLSGAVNVATTQQLSYTFNFPVDSASFIGAFSLFPAPDSLHIAFNYDRNIVTVTHSRLQTATNYTATIDSTLKSKSGGIYGRTFHQSFTTGTVVFKDTASLIYTVSPHDSATDVTIGAIPQLTFRKGMVTASVESRLKVSPPVLCGLSWQYSNSNLSLTPLNPFKTGTTYTVTLDSGYMSLDSIVGHAFAFKFTTEFLKLLGNVPFMAQVNVDIANPIALAFNAPLDTSTLAAGISASPPIAGLAVDSVVASATNAHVTYFLTHTAFRADTTYSVTVGTSVKDAFGSPLASSYTFTFTTHP
jgi:hypothetical protein